MNEHDALIRLAIGIGEWTAALSHLDALEAAGVEVPFVVRGRIEQERMTLIRHWHGITGSVLLYDDDIPTIVAEARAYATQHQPEVDALTNRQE